MLFGDTPQHESPGHLGKQAVILASLLSLSLNESISVLLEFQSACRFLESGRVWSSLLYGLRNQSPALRFRVYRSGTTVRSLRVDSHGVTGILFESVLI